MIVRSGFVSNSSSSSFIVIGTGERFNQKDILGAGFDYYIIGVNGRTDFGWEFATYTDFNSRVNFCLLQSLESGNENHYQVLIETLFDYLKVPIYVALTVSYGDEDKFPKKYLEDYQQTRDEFNDRCLTRGYIDHQSSVVEGENMEMFESVESLRDFLFNTDSYIETGNDNDEEY